MGEEAETEGEWKTRETEGLSGREEKVIRRKESEWNGDRRREKGRGQKKKKKRLRVG